MEERIIALEARFDEHCKNSKEIIDLQLATQQEWLKWRYETDDNHKKTNASLATLATEIYALKQVEVVNGKTEIKPIQIAIGEIWEATALLRAGNKIYSIINRRPLTKRLFKYMNIIVVSAILYAIFGYAILGVPLVKLVQSWIG